MAVAVDQFVETDLYIDSIWASYQRWMLPGFMEGA